MYKKKEKRKYTMRYINTINKVPDLLFKNGNTQQKHLPSTQNKRKKNWQTVRIVRQKENFKSLAGRR